jgi:hypothetical protein
MNCFYKDPVIDFWPRTEDGAGPGYSLALSHLHQARQFVATPQNVNPIALFASDYTIQQGNIKYMLVSSGRRVEMRRHLVIMQEHRLMNVTPGEVLKAEDVLALPLRVCAHLSTTTAPPPQAEQGRSAYRKNGPRRSHTVMTAFSENVRRDFDLFP